MSKPTDRTFPSTDATRPAKPPVQITPADVIKKAKDATGPRAARGDDDVMSQLPAAPRNSSTDGDRPQKS